MSLKDIAATVGVSRQIIARLARDYDLQLREPGLRARTTIDRDWLYDQYINNRRALPDIAKEAGMSTANMARWAKGTRYRCVPEAAGATAGPSLPNVPPCRLLTSSSRHWLASVGRNGSRDSRRQRDTKH
ncbi:hypothetical protein [Mycobacterium riyadhense]|uniref:hypothetical protein n=1 Tax=Mycobacterium riyadhense TaxID=486698 RepID=UPI00195CAB19|nr:hypothetical protein [Mycobacterium riyadhense]